jgi:hypothetical protein
MYPDTDESSDNPLPVSTLMSDDIVTAVSDFCFPNDIPVERVDYD